MRWSRLATRLHTQECPLDHVQQPTKSSRANARDRENLGSRHLHQQFRCRPAKQSPREVLVVACDEELDRHVRQLVAHESAQTLSGPIEA